MQGEVEVSIRITYIEGSISMPVASASSENKINMYKSTWRAMNWVSWGPGLGLWQAQGVFQIHIFIGENLDAEPCWFGNLVSWQARGGRWVALSWGPRSGIFKMWSSGFSTWLRGKCTVSHPHCLVPGMIQWQDSHHRCFVRNCQPFHGSQWAGFPFSSVSF